MSIFSAIRIIYVKLQMIFAINGQSEITSLLSPARVGLYNSDPITPRRWKLFKGVGVIGKKKDILA